MNARQWLLLLIIETKSGTFISDRFLPMPETPILPTILLPIPLSFIPSVYPILLLSLHTNSNIIYFCSFKFLFFQLHDACFPHIQVKKLYELCKTEKSEDLIARVYPQLNKIFQRSVSSIPQSKSSNGLLLLVRFPSSSQLLSPIFYLFTLLPC